MGLTLEFHLGDCKAIVQAVRDGNWRGLGDHSSLSADFSLHIIPADLDMLSTAIGLVTDQPLLSLRPSLTPVVDEVDRGVLLVAPEWVQYVSALESEQAREAADAWAYQMRSKYNEKRIVVSGGVLRAVASLQELCRRATEIDETVVHVWSL